MFSNNMDVNVRSTVYILNVVEAERRSSARVLQRLSGESFVVPVDEAKRSQNNKYIRRSSLCSPCAPSG